MLNLNYWFKPIDQIFSDFRYATLDANDPDKRRIFVDRKASVLFVAHLDTVQQPRLRKKYRNTVYGAGFDDRLGCHTAYKLAIDYNVDLLLCDNEEQGRSSAKDHVCKDYNFVVEFDREGTDVVTYGADSPEFLGALGKYWKTGRGSFSDICFLDTAACCMNLGIGHYNGHSKTGFMLQLEYKKQIQLFDKFFKENCSTKFVADEVNVGMFYDYEEDSLFDNREICTGCGEFIDPADGLMLIGNMALCPKCEMEFFPAEDNIG